MAWTISTIRKPLTSMPPSKRWSHFLLASTFCSAAKTKTVTTRSSSRFSASGLAACTPSVRQPKRSNRRSQGLRPSSVFTPSQPASAAPPSLPRPAMSCCSRPPVPASTSSKTTSTAGASSKKPCARSPSAVLPSGQAHQRRQDPLHRHFALGFRWAGHGLQRLCRHGAGALRLALYLRAQADFLGHGWHRRSSRHHERGLPPLQASGGDLFFARRDHCSAYARLLLRPRPSHPPLDPVGRFLVPALRALEACSDPVSRLLSLWPPQADRRLAAHFGPG